MDWSDASPVAQRNTMNCAVKGEFDAFAAGCVALRSIADSLVAALFAPACAVCGVPLPQPTSGPVCAVCWAAVRPLTPPLCDGCGDPLPSWRTASGPVAHCPRCRRKRRPVDRARAIGPYDGALRAIIHALKYEGRRSLATPLGRLMRGRAEDLLDGVAVAVPVPLHASRRRERGFNQAADLARALDLEVVHALRRSRATSTQTSLPAAQRHRNVRGAFQLTRRAAALADHVVLLVDDVCTTGATLDACAAVLKDAGIREVRALTAARVVSLSP
jgi:ComF family protein